MRLIPILLSIALAPLPAAAAQTSVLYAGGPASPETASRIAQMLALLEPPIESETPPFHLDEIAPEGVLNAMGADEVVRCAGEPVDRDTYLSGLSRLHDAVWEADDLAPVFGAARGSQVCLSEPPSPTSLARVNFIEGVMAFEVADEDGARASFRGMFAIEPEFPWDGQFGPGAQTAFEEVRAEVAAAPRQLLEVTTTAGSAVWLDGRLLEEPAVEVAPGRHLVQVGVSAGSDVRSLSVTVGDGPVTILDTNTLRRGADPDFEARFERIMGSLLSARPDDATWPAPALLVLLGEDPRVWSWDGAALQPMDIPRTARVALLPAEEGGRKRISPAVPILISVGAGLLAGGTVLAVASRKDLDEFDAGVESGELWPFPGPDEANPKDYPLYVQWQGKRNRLGAGYAMIAIGGASLLASIPVAAATSRARGKKVVLGASLLAGDAPQGLELEGFMLFVALR